MEYEAVEVVALRERREVLARLGRMVVVEFDDNSALRWLESSYYKRGNTYDCSVECDVGSHDECAEE